MQRIRLILAYGSDLCRAGIRTLLEESGGVEVIGEAGEGREAVRLARRRRPDIALLEDSLPGLNGIEAASRITGSLPGVRVAIISEMADAQSVAAALRAGAKGYLLKNDSPARLKRVLGELMRGRVHVSPGARHRLLRSGGKSDARERLTPRQREILQMIAEGWSTKQIAQILRISVKTVETHRSMLMERIGVYDVPGLVRYALKTRVSHL